MRVCMCVYVCVCVYVRLCASRAYVYDACVAASLCASLRVTRYISHSFFLSSLSVILILSHLSDSHLVSSDFVRYLSVVHLVCHFVS